MWRFDQGRLGYYSFDQIRKHAKFAVANDLAAAGHADLGAATGIGYPPIKVGYEQPWRNYGRTFRLMRIVTQPGGRNTPAVPTTVAHLLAQDGQVTSDDFFHFWAQSFTDPDPAFSQEWEPTTDPKFPLVFALKFLLIRANSGIDTSSYEEIIAAYSQTGFNGDEDVSAFFKIASKAWTLPGNLTNAERDLVRQARESILVLSPLSYLNFNSKDVTVSLNVDFSSIFGSLNGIRDIGADDRESELVGLADLFASSIADLDLEQSSSLFDETVEAGFTEGTRVEKTHIVLERNSAIRKAFFDRNPTTTCDFCDRDTNNEFPWSDRVLDIHHVLPLCSGTRSDKDGTVLGDLVAVCPTCHRAVHRFYTQWLKAKGKKDFADAEEARAVYDEARNLRNDT
ncbi:HNH endonuclease [Sphingobium chlorophenolicum]|nr:HNH endonuclease [Sphingobium chlorophenolicum]